MDDNVHSLYRGLYIQRLARGARMGNTLLVPRSIRVLTEPVAYLLLFPVLFAPPLQENLFVPADPPGICSSAFSGMSQRSFHPPHY